MIKEIALAITLGALLGFGITGGYLASQKNRKLPIAMPTPNLVDTSPAPTNIISIAPTATEEAGIKNSNAALIINKPDDEEIVNNSLLEISGQSTPKSLIIINTSQKHYQVVSDEKGSFQIEIELESGINNVQVDSFDQNDIQTSATFQVTYSTAKI